MTSHNIDRLTVCLQQMNEKLNELRAIPNQSPDLVPELVRLNSGHMDRLYAQMMAELLRLDVLPFPATPPKERP